MLTLYSAVCDAVFCFLLLLLFLFFVVVFIFSNGSRCGSFPAGFDAELKKCHRHQSNRSLTIQTNERRVNLVSFFWLFALTLKRRRRRGRLLLSTPPLVCGERSWTLQFTNVWSLCLSGFGTISERLGRKRRFEIWWIYQQSVDQLKYQPLCRLNAMTAASRLPASNSPRLQDLSLV